MLLINQIYLRVHGIDASEPSGPSCGYHTVGGNCTCRRRLCTCTSNTLTAMPSIHTMQSDGGDGLERASNVPQDDSHPRTPRISQDKEPSVHAMQSDNDDTPSTTSDDSADEGHSSLSHVPEDNNQNQQPEAPRPRRRRKSKRKTMGMHRPEYVAKGTFFPHLSDLRISF